MNTYPLAGVRPRVLLAVLASTAIATTGCSNMASTASSGSLSPTAALTVGGHIHGGNQPVAGATVNLYFAGSTQLATGAQKVATTTSAADGTGSFQFTLATGAPTTGVNDGTTPAFTCSGANPYVFLVARGGTTVNSTGATPNSDAAFIAPMGPCTAITANTLINMSEVVTVATMAAIHSYMDPTPASGGIEASLGADGIYASTLALSNAFDSVSNLVDLQTGMGNAQVVKTGAINGASGVSVTITPELAKINQLANIISSCINFSGSGNPNCATIYSAAVPQTPGRTSVPAATPASTPSDLLTALYNIFTNPTNSGNIASLNALAGSGPYTPTYAGTPNDWTIGVKYVATGTCSDVTGSAAGFISNPYSLDIGLNGNIFIANNQAGLGSLAQLNPQGLPTSCTTATPVNGANGQQFGSASTAVDVSPGSNNPGNVYVGNINSTDIYRFTPNFSSPSNPVDIVTTEPVYALAADGLGNIFYSTTGGNLFEITGASTGSTTSTQINNASLGTPTRLIVDGKNRIWASSSSGYVTVTSLNGGAYVTTQIPTTTAKDVTVGPASTVVSSGTSTTTMNLYVVDPGTAAVSTYSVSQAGDGSGVVTGTPTVTLVRSASGGGLATPFATALDGVGSTWSVNSTAGASTNSVAGIDSNGVAITPSTGYAKTTDYLGAQRAVTIDQSGNIWIAAGNNTITEIVGAAAPVFKSYADGLASNRFQTIP